MEIATAAVGAVLGPISNLLCGCVSSKMTTTLNLLSNRDIIVKNMDELVDRREEVKDETEAAVKEGKDILAQVVTWLEDVEKLELRVNPIQEEMVNNKKPSACFLNCSKRYKASREVEEILEEIKRLLDAGSFPNGVADPSPRAVLHFPVPSIRSQETASEILDKTKSLLDDNNVRRIGIWGPGGVGKTTLVKNLNNELSTTPTKPFGIVIWATVSKDFDMKQVQTQIAERLELKVKSEESVESMGIRLHQRLMKEEKFLLILDDVWKTIDLDTLGVPRPQLHNGCKIIFTSRSLEVCREMEFDADVKMDGLNDDEAWQLFCEKAGDVVHLIQIRPLALAIVRECCGLPIAIITVGAAIRRRTNVELWEYALKELRRSVPSYVGIDQEEVSKPLKLSYDSLQDDNTRSCFLYCSLFPKAFSIKISELEKYLLAEGLIDEQHSINRLIDNLKDSCLLEDGADEGTVKMHEVVHDFAIRIASSSEDRCKSLVPIPKAVEHIPGPSIPKAEEHLPGPSIPGQTTALKTLDKTLSLLYDDRYRVIGIWGMGGVGKTTLVRTLNNQLNNTTSTHPFGIVIWATVSRNWEMKQVQTQIARRLKLEVQMEESVQEIAIRLHQRLMNEEKFLLILDDVWVKIDLDTLGVPQPQVHKGCKIILTSRHKEVCRSMFTDFDVKIDVLNDEEAWQLFCEKAGDVFNDEKTEALAEAIVRECCGLPLAIIFVGAAMRRKEKVELWEHALKELRRSVPSIEDIEDEVYKPLKLSYDSLQGNNIKSCFLYCSLFPEDFSIEISELVRCWMGEGLIDEQQNYVDRVNTGMALIEELKDSCLLENGALEGTVKMHDVVRDVAIWIASSHDDGCKSLVRSGIGLLEISVGEFSNKNSLKRVSFMKNYITRLPDCVIEQCSEASTLLLHGNPFLQTIPERFLQGFEALRVLNLSNNEIQSLPPSLLHLHDLRALYLGDCSYLEELPPLGGLSRLQILDLHSSNIRELPKGMENLSNLRQLDLSFIRNLRTFQVSTISSWPSLEVLNMIGTVYYFDWNGAEEEAQRTFKELKHLDRLLILCISFKTIPHLSSEDIFWINRLKGFQILIGQDEVLEDYESSIANKKAVTICDANISQESIWQLCGIAKSLELKYCQGLDGNIIDLGINSIWHGLKSFKLFSMEFNRSSRPNGGLAAHCDLLPNLEELTLDDLEGLESISDILGYPGLRFLRLKSVYVCACSNMKYLFSCGDFIRTLPNLEVIEVSDCSELDELFNYDSGQNMALDPVLPKLRKLELKFLPKLRSLCRHEETWPCIEQIGVFRCDSLRRLPLTKQNAGTIKEIKGDSEWWDALEWDDDKTKSSLLPYFCPF